MVEGPDKEHHLEQTIEQAPVTPIPSQSIPLKCSSALTVLPLLRASSDSDVLSMSIPGISKYLGDVARE